MAANIRRLSYPNPVAEIGCTASKWKHANDDVFNNLAQHLEIDSDKLLIADFLNLFYYFIICYSKTCFKKHALWVQKDKKYMQREENLFRYSLANELDSHAKLLRIQKVMNDYRKEYADVTSKHKLYFTESKKHEIMGFVKESVELLCTDIYDPVVLTSDDVKIKIHRYRDDAIEQQKKKKKTQRSPRLNYAVIDKLIADGVMCKEDVYG